MIENFFLGRGTIQLNGLKCIESNVNISFADDKANKSHYIDNINRLVFEKIPQFIFQDLKNELTLILEDPNGYNIIKIFNIDEDLKYILVRIEKRIFTKNEIKKISVNINKFLDYNLNFNTLLEKIQEFFVRLETYDFSRPVKVPKIKDIGLIFNEEEKNTKIEILLPKISNLRKSTNIFDGIQYFKLKFLLNYKKKLSQEMEYDSSELFSEFISYLKDIEDTTFNKYEIACIIYDFGLILKDLELYNESNKAFYIASEKFEELKVDNLKFFTFFNIILNYKILKEYKRGIELSLKVENSLNPSDSVSNGFKGVFFRHLGELYQILGNHKDARQSYQRGLKYFDMENQVNIDTAQTHLALGVINFNHGQYFNAVRHFNFAANIFNFLNYDLKGILQKLSLSLFNLSHQYLNTLNVFLFENDSDKVVDYLIKGINYLFLSILYEKKDNENENNEICSSYLELINGFEKKSLKKPDMQILSKIKDDLEDFKEYLNISDANALKKYTKEHFEKLKDFQPLKIFYSMIIYKTNGIVLFSKTSELLEQMPPMDSDMIAGMIVAINGFLSEVLSGEDNVFFIDRDNVKIIFEYTQNLIGILFINKKSSKVRNNLKNMLQKIETTSVKDLKTWTGEISKFDYIEDLISEYLIP